MKETTEYITLRKCIFEFLFSKAIVPYVSLHSMILNNSSYVTRFLFGKSEYTKCNDKKVECVDVVMMFVDKLERAGYRRPR